MKKLVSLAIAIVAVLALSIPAAALTTEVTVSSGGGSIPVVKVKWEQEPNNNLIYPPPATAPNVNNNLESGDQTHGTPGSQFNPPLFKGAQKTLEYYAVVTDNEDSGNVLNVFALVFHPTGSPAPYGAYSGTIPDPGAAPPSLAPYYKYKVDFSPITSASTARSRIVAAYNAGLITSFGINPGTGNPYTIDEITNANLTGEIDKGTAMLWRGTAVIDYEQPAGVYTVNVYAFDHNNNLSLLLSNTFTYVALAGVEVDFAGVNFGGVNLKVEKPVAGDRTWNSPVALAPNPNPATVRNIGNTWAHVTVNNSDLGFGKQGTAAPTTYFGTTPPTAAQSNWNVFFDAKMATTPASNKRYFDPGVTAVLPNYLGLSTLEELDFSITVIQGTGTHTGTMTIGATIEPFSPTGTPGGIPD